MIGFYEILFGREEEFFDLILDFFLDNLKEEFGGGDYIFDVYVMKDKKVKLIDFNMWRGLILLFLFIWDELEEWFFEVGILGIVLNFDFDFWIVISEGFV